MSRFEVGDRVRVKSAHPPGHRRTPHCIRGKRGVVERICGAFPNPEELAYGFSEIWADYAGPERDWLEAA